MKYEKIDRALRSLLVCLAVEVGAYRDIDESVHEICNIAIRQGKKRFFIGVSIFPVTSSYLTTYKKNPKSFGSLRKKLQIFKVRTF